MKRHPQSADDILATGLSKLLDAPHPNPQSADELLAHGLSKMLNENVKGSTTREQACSGDSVLATGFAKSVDLDRAGARREGHSADIVLAEALDEDRRSRTVSTPSCDVAEATGSVDALEADKTQSRSEASSGDAVLAKGLAKALTGCEWKQRFKQKEVKQTEDVASKRAGPCSAPSEQQSGDAVLAQGFAKMFKPSKKKVASRGVWLDMLPIQLLERITGAMFTHGGPCHLEVSEVSASLQRALLAPLKRRAPLPLPAPFQRRHFRTGLKTVSVTGNSGVAAALQLVTQDGFDGDEVERVIFDTNEVCWLAPDLKAYLPNVLSVSVTWGLLFDHREWIKALSAWPLKELTLRCARPKEETGEQHWCNHERMMCPGGGDREVEDGELQTRIGDAFPNLVKLGLDCCHAEEGMNFLRIIKAFPSLRHVSLTFNDHAKAHVLSDEMIRVLQGMEMVKLDNSAGPDNDENRSERSAIQLAAKVGRPVVSIAEMGTVDLAGIAQLKQCPDLRILDMSFTRSAETSLKTLAASLRGESLQELSLYAPVYKKRVGNGTRLCCLSITTESMLRVQTSPFLRKLFVKNVRIPFIALEAILKNLGTRIVHLALPLGFQKETPCERLFQLLELTSKYNLNLSCLDYSDCPCNLHNDSSERALKCHGSTRCVKSRVGSKLFRQACEVLFRRVPTLRDTATQDILAVVDQLHPICDAGR